MPIDLRSKSSGGGSFSPLTSSGSQTVAPGSSGVLLELSNLDGKDVRLDSLASKQTSSPFAEGGIEIEVDGVILISGVLAGATPSSGDGWFAVQQTGAASGTTSTSITALYLNAGFISDVVGKVIKVKKTTGSLVATIHYSYSVGKQ